MPKPLNRSGKLPNYGIQRSSFNEMHLSNPLPNVSKLNDVLNRHSRTSVDAKKVQTKVMAMLVC
jgi:hypothetical protein